MKRILFAMPLLLLAACLAPAASAQVSVGAYADYMHLSQTSTNMAGLGARLGVKVFPATMFEAQMSYDFDQAFTEGFTGSGGGTVSTANSNVKILTGLFGPKFETPGPVKFFVTGCSIPEPALKRPSVRLDCGWTWATTCTSRTERTTTWWCSLVL
jgi:hypothetical protein